MIVCSGCGSAVEDDLQFCTECGTPNQATRARESKASLEETVRLQGAGSRPGNFQQSAISSQANSARNASYNQPTLTPPSPMPFGVPPLNDLGAKPIRTPLIIVGSVCGLLLLILGGVASKFL